MIDRRRGVTFGIPMALPTTSPLTPSEATRFLQRATFGPRPADVTAMIAMGGTATDAINAWFTAQFAAQPATTNYNVWLSTVDVDGNPSYDPSRTIWTGIFSGADQLRKRVAYALSQILVASWRELDASDVVAYADILEAGAFGSFRTLLENVSRSSVMGQYLTYQYNTKADPRSGRLPDENYAREILQLFSIGLWQLNPDGTRTLDGAGQPLPSYTQEDILGLARVFTGWVPIGDKPERSRVPMGTDLNRYETGAKTFLGLTIPAGTNIQDSLRLALDQIVGHPNTAPFICSQLIQRLVTSNPTPAYVRRVRDVWVAQNGLLGPVIRAILLDPEAWETSPPGRFGKLREPVLRYTVVTRALGIQSTGTPSWNIGYLENTATELAQHPYSSPSVFNFYRPGYVPPQTFLSDNNLVGPEFQIADETANIGWLNFLASRLRNPGTGFSYTATSTATPPDPSSLMALTGVSALIDEIAMRLCGRALSSNVKTIVSNTLGGVTNGNATNQQRDRILVAALMIAASTDFLYER